MNQNDKSPIASLLNKGTGILTEYESKLLLSAYGIPAVKEILIKDKAGLKDAMEKIGFPLVLKGCSVRFSHKTEKGLIHLDIRTPEEAERSFDEILARMDDPEGAVLVQELVKGQRELMAGLIRDPQFGPCVMFGLGGIFTEVLNDISFRVAPIDMDDAMDMMKEIRARKILDSIRGMPALNLDKMGEILINLGRIGLENPEIKEIDINPIIVSGSEPVSVDALVVLNGSTGEEK